MYSIIKLDYSNYRQYAPYDIVVFWEMCELIDSSKRVFRLLPGDENIRRTPLHEIFNCPMGARIIDVFPKNEWKTFHTGMGTGGWIHHSISDDFFKRIEGLHPMAIRQCWRDIVLEILGKKSTE